MEQKLFEIRDTGTFIPVLVTRITAYDGYLVRRAGFMGEHYLVTKLNTLETGYDIFTHWDDAARTMPVAHRHIENNWDNLKSGDVIDVEFLLGEASEPKVSEGA